MTSKKGGMSANAFAGRTRLDQLDLRQFAGPDTTPEQLYLLESIKDAAHNFIQWGTGFNGTSLNEFYWGYRYFFIVRASDKTTWDDDVWTIYKEQTSVDGDRVMVPHYLSERQIQLGCFDEHYAMVRMERHMAFDRFLTMLREIRREVVTENLPAIRGHLSYLRAKDFRHLPPGTDLGLNIETTTDADLIEVMTEPKEPRLLANLVYQPLRRKHVVQKPRIIRTPKPRVSVGGAPALFQFTEREQEEIRLMEDLAVKGPAYQELIANVHKDLCAIFPECAERLNVSGWNV